MAIGRPPQEIAPLNIETIRYEMERFGASIIFAPENLAAIRLEASERYISGDMAFKVMGIVPMWRAARMLKTPANWWEHFKQRWYPKWALKRWPVLYEWHDAAVILPKVPVVKPEWHTAEFAVWRKSSEPIGAFVADRGTSTTEEG